MKFFSEHKAASILTVCVIAVVGLLIFFGLHSGSPTASEDAVKSVSTPVQKFFTNIGNSFYDITHSLGQLKELRTEVDELKSQNNKYEQLFDDNEELLEENDRLKRMLELRDENPDLDMIAATVAADEPSNWFSGFTIDKGEHSGIAPDQIVISTDGFLIGKIVSVGTNWADVMTVTDPAFSAGVMVERSRDLGVAEGDTEYRYNRQFKLSYLARDVDIEVGDYITTTGLGGTFPAGFRLGKVADIKDDNITMTRYAIVDVCADLSDVRRVFVITNSMDVVADEENENMKSYREEAERKQEEIDSLNAQNNDTELNDDDDDSDYNDEDKDEDEDEDEYDDEDE